MVERGGGRIIGISTEAALQCFSAHGAYAAGKRGMDGVLRCLAREVGPHGVTVNQIAPGWMITDKDREAGKESHPGYESGVPLRRRGEDTDIAAAVAFSRPNKPALSRGRFCRSAAAMSCPESRSETTMPIIQGPKRHRSLR
jgi:3-oxoacyl-[acyl-carrier protein] reductase